jgi:hypothetical protein
MSPRASCVFQAQIVPRVKSAISNVVHCAGAEVHNELSWDSIAMAAKIQNTERPGKATQSQLKATKKRKQKEECKVRKRRAKPAKRQSRAKNS